MSEGIYTGICGDTKAIWKLLQGKTIGIIFPALAKFLMDEYAFHSPETDKEINSTYSEIKSTYATQGHSGGSSAVLIQQLFDLLGARTLSKEELDYIKKTEDE